MLTITDARIGQLFNAASGLKADNENDSAWLERRRVQPPVCSDRRVSGFKATGSPPDFRVVYWETSDKPGEHNVGLMKESYVYGTQMGGTPDTMLWLHSTHTTKGAALMQLDALYRDNVFEMFKEMIEKKGLTLLAGDRKNLPFGQPEHWRDSAARNLSLVSR